MPGVNRSASLLEGLLDPKFAGEPDRSRRCEFALLSPATRCSRLRRAGSPEPEAGEAEVGDAEVTPNDDADDIFQATPPAPAPHPSSCPRRPRSFAKVLCDERGKRGPQTRSDEIPSHEQHRYVPGSGASG